MMEPLKLSDMAQELADEVRRAAGKLSSLRDLAEDWKSGHDSLITQGEAAQELKEILDD
jgi:hypothetical protein